MAEKPEFYICQVCFNTSTEPAICHEPMIVVNSGKPGDDLRKPVKDQFGHYQSRLPMWFLVKSSRSNLKDLMGHKEDPKKE